MPTLEPPGGAMVPRRFRITQKRRETPDTYTFAMAPVDHPGSGTATTGFQPGQFSMLYLFGYGEVPISISGDPANTAALVYTVRAVGSVTHAFAALEPGDMVGVRGPFGSAWPLAQAEGKDVLLVAGGLGLAPLRSVIHSVLANRDRYRRLFILYGSRNPEAFLFADQLSQWHARADITCEATVDYAGTGWTGRVGVITELVRRADFTPDQAIAFVCGPEMMMRVTVEELKKRGVADRNIHLSLERSMKCAIGHCGHCQFGPVFVCKDGPILRYDRMQTHFGVTGL